MTTRPWRDVLTVAAFALLAFWALDLAAGRLAPPIIRREVGDGVRDLSQTDPHLLVLGSSHARSFEAVADQLAAASNARIRTVTIPVEFGKFTAYEWVLQHRLRPLLEAHSADGRRLRPSLERLVLVTEWWDGCAPFGNAPLASLPSRAWTWRDFTKDVRVHGLTAYNRNYLQSAWRRLWSSSALMQDRGKNQVLLNAHRRVADTPATIAAREAAFVADWRAMIEGGDQCLGDPEQMAALDGILDWASAAGVQATIVLFPRKPNTITATARSTTLPHYAEQLRAAAARTGAEVIDLTLDTPLGDADFMADFDHVTATGNAKFARWALAGALADLGSLGKLQSTSLGRAGHE